MRDHEAASRARSRPPRPDRSGRHVGKTAAVLGLALTRAQTGVPHRRLLTCDVGTLSFDPPGPGGSEPEFLGQVRGVGLGR